MVVPDMALSAENQYIDFPWLLSGNTGKFDNTIGFVIHLAPPEGGVFICGIS
ncbi:hypothetical protein [Entomohabitans teleogrylli]|uniref:hypothetical protein n=1 Tax=Entomohabitans teleogrylli TaxID=1384589 RepID=UPI0012B68F7C|nr:hypothetical protein [Entomohabitans teleogrylli]